MHNDLSPINVLGNPALDDIFIFKWASQMAYPKTVLSNTCHQQPRVLPHHHFHLLLHTRARRFVFTIIGCISSIAWQNCICPTIATLARNNHHHLHHFSTFDASAPCHCCHNFRLFNYRHLLVAAVHIAPYLCAIASVTTATSPS